MIGYSKVEVIDPCSCGAKQWVVTYQDGTTDRLHWGLLTDDTWTNPIKRDQLGLEPNSISRKYFQEGVGLA